MGDDKEVRKPLSADDIELIKGGFDKLDASDQLLVRLLACTGMRLGEAFEIGRKVKVKVEVKIDGKWVKQEQEQERTNGDMVEHGVRFVTVGTKTETSLRRVPLPADVLPFLPAKITGPLFEGDAESASKRLNKFLRSVGIDDTAKVVHSFRHRAKDRLRAAACPLAVQYELLGHEVSTLASGYGHGSPVPLLKEWVDKIGF